MKVVAVLALLAACGRFGFEGERRDAPVDVAIDDGPGDVTEPEAPSARELVIPMATTTSATFEDIPGATLTVPPSPGTRWLLAVSASLESSSLNEHGPEARYLVDGVERGIGGTEAVVAGRPGPWQHLHVIDGGIAPIEIRFQLRDGMLGTTQLRDLHAAVVPVPASADLQVATADAITPVTTTAFSDIHTLTLSPQSAGDYIVMLLVNANEAPTSSNIEVQWLGPQGGLVTDDYLIPRGSWQSILTMRRIALAPGAGSRFVLQALSGASMSSVQYARVIALRVDTLGDQLAYAERFTTALATTTTPVYPNELMPTLGAATSYFVFGTMRVDDNNCAGTIAERGVHFAVDAERAMTTHRPGNCAYETTYGLVRLLPSPPAYVAAGVSAQNGVDVQHDESGLLVLGVD